VLIVVVHLRVKYEVPRPSGLAKIPPLATDTFLTTDTFHAKHYIIYDDDDGCHLNDDPLHICGFCLCRNVYVINGSLELHGTMRLTASIQWPPTEDADAHAIP
jgi:hypothetical protein